jgi:hypothetical protein
MELIDFILKLFELIVIAILIYGFLQELKPNK